jgi:hypothetical protein
MSSRPRSLEAAEVPLVVPQATVSSSEPAATAAPSARKNVMKTIFI